MAIGAPADWAANEAAADPWTRAMLAGDLATAWRICDDVLRHRAGQSSAHLPRHEQWIWNGTPLAGRRVLVRCYHGLGDTVQFIRFAARLRGIAREVTVWAQELLIPLLRTARGIDRLLPLHDGAPGVPFDVDVESMELAHVFRPTLATLPADVPYLHPPVAAPRRRDRFHVGLVWSAGTWNPARSVPVEQFAPLLRIEGIEWHLLQRGPALAEWPYQVGETSGTDDILATATTMTSLDLVITVDSFPAHLAGALGVRTWTLLAHQADWRWLRDRADSPWYPTMRLFRQPRAGDWSDVIASVENALRQLVAGHDQPVSPAAVQTDTQNMPISA